MANSVPVIYPDCVQPNEISSVSLSYQCAESESNKPQTTKFERSQHESGREKETKLSHMRIYESE